MKRKIVQTGGSLAVTLPQEVVEAFKLKKGQEVDLSVHPRTGAITVRTGVSLIQEGRVTRAFKESVDELLRKRAELYRRLA